MVFLEETREGVTSMVISSKFESSQQHIVLGMDQKDAKLSFYYELEATGKNELIADIDAKLLSTRVAGGFVGASIGLFARSE